MGDPQIQTPAAEQYWHLWTDAEGMSRHQLCTISEFKLGRLGPWNSPKFSRDLRSWWQNQSMACTVS